MKSKINIKLLFFLTALICLILTILTIRTTYARYITSLTAKSYIEMGRWLIRVNDQNIMQNSDISGVITPTFADSEYIAEGKIAPTSNGYVEINLDYKEVTVPFKYEIYFSYDSTVLEDFRYVSYSIDDGEIITVDSDSPTITDTISPTATNRTRNLKLNFSWYDGTGENLDDTEDTAFSANVDEIGLHFTLKFTQLTKHHH